MSVDDFVDMVLGQATKEWYMQYLNITEEEYNRLWDEETLTELQERIDKLYFENSDERCLEMLQDL